MLFVQRPQTIALQRLSWKTAASLPFIMGARSNAPQLAPLAYARGKRQCVREPLEEFRPSNFIAAKAL